MPCVAVLIYTASALTIISLFRMSRKVRCHMTWLLIFVIYHDIYQFEGISDGSYRKALS
jgi:hypothetical protein